MMEEEEFRVSTMQTGNTVTSVSSPVRVGGGREASQPPRDRGRLVTPASPIHSIASKVERLLEENKQLRDYLYLIQDTQDLRCAAVVGTVLSWIDGRDTGYVSLDETQNASISQRSSPSDVSRSSSTSPTTPISQMPVNRKLFYTAPRTSTPKKASGQQQRQQYSQTFTDSYGPSDGSILTVSDLTNSVKHSGKQQVRFEQEDNEQKVATKIQPYVLDSRKVTTKVVKASDQNGQNNKDIYIMESQPSKSYRQENYKGSSQVQNTSQTETARKDTSYDNHQSSGYQSGDEDMSNSFVCVKDQSNQHGYCYEPARKRDMSQTQNVKTQEHGSMKSTDSSGFVPSRQMDLSVRESPKQGGTSYVQNDSLQATGASDHQDSISHYYEEIFEDVHDGHSPYLHPEETMGEEEFSHQSSRVESPRDADSGSTMTSASVSYNLPDTSDVSGASSSRVSSSMASSGQNERGPQRYGDEYSSYLHKNKVASQTRHQQHPKEVSMDKAHRMGAAKVERGEAKSPAGPPLVKAYEAGMKQGVAWNIPPPTASKSQKDKHAAGYVWQRGSSPQRPQSASSKSGSREGTSRQQVKFSTTNDGKAVISVGSAVKSGNQDDSTRNESDNTSKLDALMSSQAYSSSNTHKRLIGEIGFQLDRRILRYVFFAGTQRARRLYGYTVNNIPDMIRKEAFNSRTGMIDNNLQATLMFRYEYILHSLRPLGYEISYHGLLCTELVNKYGLLPIPREKDMQHFQFDAVRDIVCSLTSDEELEDVLIILNCLDLLATDEGKPLFVW